MAFETETPVKCLIHGCAAGDSDDKNVVPVTPQAAAIDSLFNHHSVRADGSEESCAGVGPLTAPTQSMADNTQAAPVIDDLVRNSPLFAASFTNGSVRRATHPVGWLEPREDSWETKVKG